MTPMLAEARISHSWEEEGDEGFESILLWREIHVVPFKAAV